MSDRLPPPIGPENTAPIGDPCRVLPTTGTYDDIGNDYTERANVWREIDEEAYDEALDVLPPIMLGGQAFMVSEPFTNDERTEETVYAAFVKTNFGGQKRWRYFVRYCTRRAFPRLRDELRSALAEGA